MTFFRTAELWADCSPGFVIWTRTILEEAVDQDFILKNPAKKLTLPETRAENKRYVTLNEIPIVLARLPFREHLILRMSLVLGLQPGELFALRWDDIEGYALRLDESTVDGTVYSILKTEKSRGFVALPASLRVGLAEWRQMQRPRSDQDFLFPNADGGVHRCATHLSRHGGVKEVQGHLRHARATTTLDIYVQEIPEAVREAVESWTWSLQASKRILTIMMAVDFCASFAH